MIRTLLGFLLVFLASCGVKEEGEKLLKASETRESYFPVTSYIRGQILEIKEAAVNPLLIVSNGDVVDSTWLKIEDVNATMSEFLVPLIDTTNLQDLFSETKFLDQSINTYTFSYLPVTNLPDSFQLKRWDIYVNPVNGKVQKIYMEKYKNGKTLHLTWQSDILAKIITVSEKDGKSIIEEERVIRWDF